MTQRENILSALLTLLLTIPDAKTVRNEVLPEKVSAGGLIIMRDGEPGEPEVTLSPLSYYWQHRATLDVLVSDIHGAARDQKLDDLFAAIAAAIDNDPTLGGLCDLAMPLAPETSTLGIEGAPQIKAAIVPIQLFYTTTSQLG